MATTLTTSTLTVEITETITLNGVARNSAVTTSIASIAEIHNRILTVDASAGGTGIFDIAATLPGPGTFSIATFDASLYSLYNPACASASSLVISLTSLDTKNSLKFILVLPY